MISKIKLILSVLLLIPFYCSAFVAPSQDVKKVAILDIVDRDNSVSRAKKLIVRSALTHAVTNTPGYEAYTRVDIASVFSEHDFQRTGAVSEEQIKKLGEMAGVAYILIAEVAAEGDEIVVVAQIIDVETAQIIRSADAQMPSTSDGAAYACDQLAAQLLSAGMRVNSYSSNTKFKSSTSNSSQTSSTSQSSTKNYKKSNAAQKVYGYLETIKDINMQMILVEAGSFKMGGTVEQGADTESDEMERTIIIDEFYIGQFEVTQGQWEAIMGSNIEMQRDLASPNFSIYGEGVNYPMYYISWEDANAFCERLSQLTGKKYSLPTEAEWEYAARGGHKHDGTKYSGSMIVQDVAWHNANSEGSTHEVGTLKANGLGVCDMSGNVCEWCTDWYGDYMRYDTNNPKGEDSGSHKVVRGGGWINGHKSCRVSFRRGANPQTRESSFGFRVVMHK